MEIDYTKFNGEKKKNYVLYMNWDGFGYEWYRMVNESYGGTPHLNQLLKEGTMFTNARSGIPSITGAMQQCIVSGAWPADTGNCYRYYNKAENRVVQFARQNKLENIAEAARKRGIGTAAVHAWYFENRGNDHGDLQHPYIIAGLPSNFTERVDELIKLYRGEPVRTGEQTVTFTEPPQFLSIYADDIDTVGHNEKVKYEGMRLAETWSEWHSNIARTIQRMDADLGRLVAELKHQGLYERTTIVLTADHGMVRYGASSRQAIEDEREMAISRLADLRETMADAGTQLRGRRFKVEVLCRDGMKAEDDTDIVITAVCLQAQINFRLSLERREVEEIVSRVQQKQFYGTHMVAEELVKHGAMDGFADLLISPRPPYHFRWNNPNQPYAVWGSHDSLDEHAQHVFLMVAGANVNHGTVCDRPVSLIDIAPTMARLLGFEGPQAAVGSALDEALQADLRGPKLAVTGKITMSGMRAARCVVTVQIDTEPGAAVRINRQMAGEADEQGSFIWQAESKAGMNRIIVEAEHRQRVTRQSIFVDGGESIN